MINRIFLSDKYEAIKFKTILDYNNAEKTISSILSVIGNEIIIQLNDRSAHSVTFFDSENAENAVYVIEKLLQGDLKFLETDQIDNEILIK